MFLWHQLLSGLLKTVIRTEQYNMNKLGLLRKAFLSSYYFTIAIKHRNSASIIENAAFDAEYVAHCNPRDWCADPILVDYNDKTWLFYEKVNKGKGRIEVAEVKSDCSISKPTVLFSDDHHYSYPFVFSVNGQMYMIPETSDQSEVKLFRCVVFPDQWVLEKVLLKGCYVDTTLFCYNGDMYILTFELLKNTERVKPHIFRVIEWNLFELKWINYDGLQVRGAGPIIEEDDRLYRPVQISKEDRYGDSIKLVEMKITDNTYQEVETAHLLPESIRCRRIPFYDGLHTYSRSIKYEAIDIRCRKYSITRPAQYLKSRF